MMEEKDLQGIDVATSIGTSRGYVSKLCHGNGSIDAVKLYRIYTEFGTTPNLIILGEEVEDSYSKEYIYNHPEFICGDLVFVTKLGGPMNCQNFSDGIKAVLRVVNEFRDPLEQIESFTAHCFRHTFATRCFEGGVSMKAVQNMLGHATIAMTMDLYTHILDKHKVDEMAKLQDEFDRVEGTADDLVDKQYEEFKAKESEIQRQPVKIPKYS